MLNHLEVKDTHGNFIWLFNVVGMVAVLRELVNLSGKSIYIERNMVFPSFVTSLGKPELNLSVSGSVGIVIYLSSG